MNLKALVGAAALSALVMSGAAVAYAQDAGQAPGTMAPIPNPPETPKKVSHHHGKHMAKHMKMHAKKASAHHMAKKAPEPKTDAK
jgi:hypothetical protein